MTNRVPIVVFVDLDPLPGAFHTKERAAKDLRSILERVINHYNPEVISIPQEIIDASQTFTSTRHGPVAAGQQHNAEETAWQLAQAIDDYDLFRSTNKGS